MDFTCPVSALAEAVNIAQRATDSRSLPILTGLRLDLTGNRLTVTGSDQDLTIQHSVQVTGKEDGSAIITARVLADIIRSLPQDAQIHFADAGDKGCAITAGRFHATLGTYPVEDWPNVLREVAGDDIQVEASMVVDALRRVTPSASTDESRPVITGVNISSDNDDAVVLAATDSYRLATAQIRSVADVLAGQTGVIVPAQALDEFRKVIGDDPIVNIRLDNKAVRFSVGDTVIITRLIEGDFPAWRQLLPDVSTMNFVEFDREELAAVVKRVKLLARENTPVVLNIGEEPNLITLSAKAEMVGEASDSVDATISGEHLRVAFNPTYLLAGLEAASSERVRLYYQSEPRRPVLLREENGDPTFNYLLMPMQV